MIDKKKLRSILKQQEMADHEIDVVISRLERIHPKLQRVLEQWVKDRTISEEVNVNGVTIAEIMKRKEGFLNALFTLNVLLDHPQLASMYQKPPVILYQDRNPFAFLRGENGFEHC